MALTRNLFLITPQTYVILICATLGLLEIKAWSKCATPPPAVAKSSTDKVYEGLPYIAGETAKYQLYWTKIRAGDLSLQVLEPVQEEGEWFQNYAFEAKTSDSFKHIYIGRYQGKAFVKPANSAISKFRLSIYRDPPLESPYKEDKWLQFNQEDCEVEETIKIGDKPLVKKSFPIEFGTNDALGIFFKLRTLPYEMGRTEKVLVYSSEKNWWLEAIPQGMETIKVPFGEFKAMKVKLLSYLGKDLQQKGDVFAWIATEHPKKPLLQIEADVKIGSVRILLESLNP